MLPGTHPSSGVMPMDVSTLTPFFTAVMLLPLPAPQVWTASC